MIFFQPSYAKIYKWTDDKGRTHFSDKPSSTTHSNANKNSAPKQKTNIKKYNSDKYQNLKNNNTKLQLYPNNLIINLRSLLKQKKYKELNNILHQHQMAYEKDYSFEDQLFWAYDAFESKDRKFIVFLNNWIKSTPKSYQPYLARAKYFYRQGWLSRGHKWSSETKETEKNKMKYFFKKSDNDINKALNIRNNLVVAQHLLIGISNTQGDENDVVYKVAKKALKTNSLSYNVRAMFLHSLTPRWGGSYEKMQEFIDTSLKYAKNNTKLNLLQAHIYADAAEEMKLIKKHSTSEELFTQALEFGDNHKLFNERAINRIRIEDYHGALKDLNRAIKLHPEKYEYYYWRSRSYSNLKEYDKATSDILKANKLEPTDEYNIKQTNWLSNELENIGYKQNGKQKYNDALKNYNTALTLTPYRAVIHHRKAQSYLRLNKMEKSLESIKKSINLKPDNIEAYTLLDWLLARNKDWDQIISYWNQYLTIQPNDGRAYAERSGTYYHKGNMEQALKDAKKSADLGYAMGKEVYAKLKRIKKQMK